MPDEFVDSGAACRGLECEDAVSLASDLTEFGANAERDAWIRDDACCPQAPPDGAVGWSSRFLAKDQRERAVATEAALLMQDGDVFTA